MGRLYGGRLQSSGLPESMAGMSSPLFWSVTVGSLTFLATYVALISYALISFGYFSGPAPSLLYGLPIPLFLGLVAGAIAFRVKGSD